jgi:hypothetical protein
VQSYSKKSSAQEMICKERESSLLISLGADKNCNHPYEYEKNRCKSEQAKQKKAFDESLKKHTVNSTNNKHFKRNKNSC